MTAWERISALMEERGTTNKELADYIQTRPQTITDWKKGKTQSYTKFYPKIAAYFGVSVDYLAGSSPLPDTSNVTKPDGGTVHYRPVFNSVSAGFGAYADSDVVGFVPLIISNPYDVDNTICINVRGDSMYPDIPDGSTIVVRKQDTIESGQIGVVLIGDEGFVKRVELGTDFVRLISTNPEYPPRTLRGSDLECVKIVGLVQKVIRDL